MHSNEDNIERTENDVPEQKTESEQKKEISDNSHYSSTYELNPNEHYEVNGYSYETDRYGRIKECSGQLHFGESKRSPTHQAKAGGEDRRETDDGGHLIAFRFDGSGKVDNIVAMDSHLNRSDYKEMENKWSQALERNATVDVEIRPHYRRDSKRPDEINVRYTITESDGTSYTMTKRFKNG